MVLVVLLESALVVLVEAGVADVTVEVEGVVELGAEVTVLVVVDPVLLAVVVVEEAEREDWPEEGRLKHINYQ